MCYGCKKVIKSYIELFNDDSREFTDYGCSKYSETNNNNRYCIYIFAMYLIKKLYQKDYLEFGQRRD